MKVLIVKMSSLGDIIHTLPCLVALKQNNHDVTWLINTSYNQILENSPQLKQTILFERERWRGLHAITRQNEIWRLAWQIRQTHFDAVLDFQGLFRSGFFARMSGAKDRFGFADSRELSWLAYNHCIDIPLHMQHAVERNAYLTEQFLGHSIPRIFSIPISQAERDKASFWIHKLPAIVLVPGARWESKRWPLEHFIELIEMLEGSSLSIVLVGSKSDLPLTETILQRVKRGFIGNTPVHLTGATSLKELAAVMSLSSLVISNDSGPMHIAAAVGTPVLALFGPTDPNKTAPYGNKHRILQHRLPCWPCRNRQCQRSPSCIASISPQEVFANIQQMLTKI